MRHIILLTLLLLTFLPANAQRYITKNGYIGFFSHTPLEDIKADNNQVASILDTSTGDIVFQVLIRSFHFEKALMEEHFNENYMDSEKYPRGNFTGKITNISDIDFKKQGSYNVTVEGELTIKDVTKKVNAKGTIEVLPDGISANSKFNLAPEDYNIAIPGVVREKIAKDLELTVTMKYAPMQ